ncbi:PIN domain-containing protein [Phycicoccus sp. CSK15P-2]|uniref:PIN domain-containing protein n=1 Tax=Phycicoccus sp. CSK15P-2 TaxID=2807627 RepID=UPI0019507210|nr:PIN domain-containing protein [Phycicoccus sp. CSK15P-2]MBM6404096.1 PIN domain-containing protein [Phycicoccus sp. CSK15P-2]
MSLSVTLADANVLISRTLRDYFVYAAKLGALDIHWSEGILDETTRNLIDTFDFTQEDAEVLVDRLSAYIPTALVEVKKRDETRVAKVDMDAKDRHVLAAALSAHAELLLTQNVRHFPREWMSKRGIELVNAGALLTRLADEYPDILREAHRLGLSSRPQTETDVFAILVDQVGEDVMAVVRAVVTAEPAAQSESDSAG